jgi:hypothetical protein
VLIDVIDRLTDRVLEALARPDAPDSDTEGAQATGALRPHALTLILRRYGATGRHDLAEAFGLALARVIESSTLLDPACSASGRAEWLKLLIEASRMSDDPRPRAAAADLVSSLRQSWQEDGQKDRQVEPVALSIDACLMAADIVGPREIVPAAVDELERLMASAYRPGCGMSRAIVRRAGVAAGTHPACLGDQVRSASALLTAYSCTDRLPYGMLAEELMEVAHRTLWDEETGGFAEAVVVGGAGTPAAARPFGLNCEAARVLCRLAALCETEEYRARAVLAPDADHRGQAVRTLEALERCCRDQDVDSSAIYGIALDECLGAA